MNKIEWLPKAIKDIHHPPTHAYNDTTHWKIINHQTETKDKPSYDGWTINPHLTVVPEAKKGITIYQHVNFLNASFALRDLAGGVRPNRDAAIQIEFVGTCSKSGPGYYWPDADAIVLEAVYLDIYLPLMDSFGIPWNWCESASYEELATGKTSVRCTPEVYDTFTGFMGHQNVSENTHLDGQMNTGRLSVIRGFHKVLGSDTPKEDDEMKMLILNPAPDEDKDDPTGVWVYEPGVGLRSAVNMFEVALLRKAGAIDVPCTEADLRSLVPAGQKP